MVKKQNNNSSKYLICSNTQKIKNSNAVPQLPIRCAVLHSKKKMNEKTK